MVAVLRRRLALWRLVEHRQWSGGILNIFCMTGWWAIYSSKNQDMLWPDMTWLFILAMIQELEYTHANLPTHAWY